MTEYADCHCLPQQHDCCNISVFTVTVLFSSVTKHLENIVTSVTSVTNVPALPR